MARMFYGQAEYQGRTIFFEMGYGEAWYRGVKRDEMGPPTWGEYLVLIAEDEADKGIMVLIAWTKANGEVAVGELSMFELMSLDWKPEVVE